MDANERRAILVAKQQAETGIDEALIHRVVHTFYDSVRADELLGPVFETRIEDWEMHLGRMCEFWSGVVLLTGRYHGQPMVKHAPLPVDSVHFDRWLALFEATVRDVCPPSAATIFLDRARRIAESLELGVASHAGKVLAKGERFHREPAV